MQRRILRLRGLDPGNLQVGDRVLAFVRPENIEILPNGAEPAKENLLRGRVEQIVFEGPTVRLLVDVDGTPIRVSASGLGRLTLLDKERRDVALRLQGVTVVQDDAGAAG